MTWNYRIVRQNVAGIDRHAIHEAYYDPSGKLYAITREPVAVASESVEEVRDILRLMGLAVAREVVDYESVPEVGVEWPDEPPTRIEP